MASTTSASTPSSTPQSTALMKIRQRLSSPAQAVPEKKEPSSLSSSFSNFFKSPEKKPQDLSIVTRKIGTGGPEGAPSPATPETQSTKVGVFSMIPAGIMGFFSYKVVLVILVLMIVFYYIRPYIGHMNDIINILRSFMNSSVDLGSETNENEPETENENETETETTGKKEKQKKKQQQQQQKQKQKDDEESNEIEKIAKKINDKPSKLSSQNPQPDDSASSVQGGAKSGFCLAGEWKGVRTCVKVDKGNDCTSGQLFDTDEQCVHPGLR